MKHSKHSGTTRLAGLSLAVRMTSSDICRKFGEATNSFMLGWGRCRRGAVEVADLFLA